MIMYDDFDWGKNTFFFYSNTILSTFRKTYSNTHPKYYFFSTFFLNSKNNFKFVSKQICFILNRTFYTDTL